MAIRFVVGRAGTGKTRRCLDAIRTALRTSPVNGPPLLLLVPEQASFQMERALVETPDLAGFTRCEVLSFQRLAYRIFSETGVDPRRGDQTIGSLGRLMVLRRLMRRERTHLSVLGRVADKPGLVKQVATALDELMRQEITPEQLVELSNQDRATFPLEAAKLADLTRLYQSYLDYLLTDRLDPAQYLALAAERLEACHAFDGAHVWVDGFAGFTAQEYHLLGELARRVDSVEVTLLVDPDASAIEATKLPAFSQSLFSRTGRTLVRLRTEMTARQVAMAEPVRLRQPYFAPELAKVEAHLFAGRAIGKTGEEARGSGDALRVIECADRRGEVAGAIGEIQRLTRAGLRYRDIAIIVRDLGAYHDFIRAEARAHDIPCFIDRRQPTTHHPLVELVRGLLALAADNCRLESVRLLLKTGLLPMTSGQADTLENYLLACGISGWTLWAEPWKFTRAFRLDDKRQLRPFDRDTLAEINRLRGELVAALGEWMSPAVAADSSGQSWAAALYACLQRLGVPERIDAWAREAEDDGRTEEADAHRQVWAEFVELIDEFIAALGDTPLSVHEFRETLEAGLAEFSIGLAPPTLDQVLVGAIERSRHPNVRAALILGFDESLFPMKRSEDPLLGDREREVLDDAGIEIGPSRRRQLLDERMLAYIALTRASERVWLSYPRSDGGKPLQASPYLADILSAVPGVAVEKRADEATQRSPVHILSAAELGGRLALEMRTRPVIDQESASATRAEWNWIYQEALRSPDVAATLRRTLAGLGYRNVSQLDADLIAQVYESPFAASVSRLERFAECPYSHFLEYVLRLEPRAEAEMDQVDLGTMCHAVLEQFIAELAAEGRSLAELEADDINERVDRLAANIIPEIANEMVLGEARNQYLLDRSRGHLSRVTQWQRNAARVGKFKPKCTEYPFGYDASNRLTLTTPAGRTVYLRGRIDRVDVAELGGQLAAVVIDYKRTRQRVLDVSKVYHGLTLQLVAYLLALQQGGKSLAGRPIMPVGAFYLPLLEAFGSVPHPSEDKKQSYKFRGVMDGATLAALDETVTPGGGSSSFYGARLKKDGGPYAGCDLAGSPQFKQLIQFVGRKMGALADDLLDGNIRIEPYRLQKKMPCSFCQYRPVCRFDVLTEPARALDAIGRDEAFEQISLDLMTKTSEARKP